MIEIANRIGRGRAAGTDYVVTAREHRRSGILARFEGPDARAKAETWEAEHKNCCVDRTEPCWKSGGTLYSLGLDMRKPEDIARLRNLLEAGAPSECD